MNSSEKADNIFEIVQGFAKAQNKSTPKDILTLFDEIRGNGTLCLLLGINTQNEKISQKCNKTIDHYRSVLFSNLFLSNDIYSGIDPAVLENQIISFEKHEAVVKFLSPKQVGLYLFDDKIDAIKIKYIGKLTPDQIEAIGIENFILESMSSTVIKNLAVLTPFQIKALGIEYFVHESTSTKKVNCFTALKKYHTEVLGFDFLRSPRLTSGDLHEILKIPEDILLWLKNSLLGYTVSGKFLKILNQINIDTLKIIGKDIILNSLDNPEKLFAFSKLSDNKIDYLRSFYNRDGLTKNKISILAHWDIEMLRKIKVDILTSNTIKADHLRSLKYEINDFGDILTLNSVPLDLLERYSIFVLMNTYRTNLSDSQKRKLGGSSHSREVEKSDPQVVKYYGLDYIKGLNNTSILLLKMISIDQAKVLPDDFLATKDINPQKKSVLLQFDSKTITNLPEGTIEDSQVNPSKLRLLIVERDYKGKVKKTIDLSKLTLDKLIKAKNSSDLI